MLKILWHYWLIVLLRAGNKTNIRYSYSESLNNPGDSVIVTDATCTITRINPVAERLTGWTRENAIGQPIDNSIPGYG